MRLPRSTGNKGNGFVKGPDAFRAFYFLLRGLGYQNGKALKKGTQTFIDFASLLCENPRKRLLLRA